MHDAFRYLYFRDLTVSDVDRRFILSNRARAGKAVIPATMAALEGHGLSLRFPDGGNP